MCKKTKQESKVFADRTQGLDSRGNRAMATQAESEWANETLKSLRDNDEAMTLLTDELQRIYDDTKNVKGIVDKRCVAKFQKGFEDYFGKYDDKEGQMRRTAAPKAQPKPEDMVNLMLEERYDFKEAVDTLARVARKTDDGQQLYAKGRGKVEEFKERGRTQGRKRKASFIGPQAGITDRNFRPEDLDNFFSRDVPHYKAVWEGDPDSATYQKFVDQGAPFIGGVSGTIQGIAMGMELEKKLDDIDDDDQRDEEIARREQTVAFHMATLVAGGHHSVPEMLFAAQQHGLFTDIGNPLDNYPKAMQQLEKKLVKYGLPGGLTPAGGKAWLAALDNAQDDIDKVGAEIIKLFPDQKNIHTAFNKKFVNGFVKLFPRDLAGTLDKIVSLVDDPQTRSTEMASARTLIADARKSLTEHPIVLALDINPFISIGFHNTLERALEQISSLAADAPGKTAAGTQDNE